MMIEIWICLYIHLASANERGLVSAADLHRAMDQALAAGWQPKNEADLIQPGIEPDGQSEPR